MERPMQVEILRDLLSKLERNTTETSGVMLKTPTSLFTNKDIAAKEWERFFENHPQIVGLSTDLPEPGSFLTIGDLGVPILATRDSEGGFRAFVNTCRHRGAQVTDEPRGKRTRFTCPWHGWTYSNGGDLMAVRKPEFFGEVDLSCHGLVELPSVEKYGLLFVHPQVDGTIDADALLGELGPELESWQIGQSAYMGNATIDEPVNWKIAKELFAEVYHFETLHKNTLAKSFHGDVFNTREYGRNSRICVANKFIDQVRNQADSEWFLTDAGIVVYYLFPNTHIVLANNVAVLARLYPDPANPAHSITRLSYYDASHTGRPIEANETVNVLTDEDIYDADTSVRNTYSLEAIAELFVSTARDEDFYAAAMAQKSADGGKVDYFLIGKNEPAVQHFYHAYRDALGMPAAEEYRA